MRVARREVYAGWALLVALIAITILPFVSIFTTALYPSGSVPVGLSIPPDPQWGNFLEAFKVANMRALLGSSVFIVLAVVPISLLISTMAGFAIGSLRIPGGGLLLLLFVFGLTLPFEGIITPLYFLARQHGDPEHPPRHRPAAHRPVHAVRRVLDACPLRQHARARSRRRHASTAPTPGTCSGGSMSRLRARPMASLGILMSVWAWNQFLLALVLVEDPTQRTMAGALGAFQGHYATDIPLLSAGTILILVPTLLLFIVFQRQVIAALLQGSVKG